MQATPKQRMNVSGDAGQFSPVVVAESPVSKSSQRRSLTGNLRVVRDLAADIHANIQQWNTAHLCGVSTLKAIAQAKVDEGYSETLQNLCDALEDDCNALDEIVNNLKQLAHQMKIIRSLHKSTENLFLTWPVKLFEHATQKIYEAYRDEAELKHKVLENVAHDHRESWKMLHLTMWIHQTKIPENLTTLLESMLVETGHR